MIKTPQIFVHPVTTNNDVRITRIKPNWRKFEGMLTAILSVTAATFVGTGMLRHLDHRLCLPIYLLAVVHVSTRYGYGPSLFTCLLSLLTYEFFLSPPIFCIFPIHVPVLIYFLSIMIISVMMSRRTLQIKKLAESLESQVEARTIELSESNKKLMDEIRQKSQVESQLRDALHRLVEMNSQLRHFHKVAAHDLREPLRTTKGYIHLIQRRFGKQVSESLDTYLEEMHKTLNGMEDLIDGIKCLTDAERASLKMARFQALDCVQSALTNLSSEITETGAEIRLEPLPEICADRRLLLVLFQNLIANSLKFCRNRKPKIEIYARKKEDFWEFSVTDNGIGIDPSYREQVFRLFSRLNSRSEFNGSGIGLSLCQSIIRKHGGEIWFNSEPGKGSTFSFSLPEITKTKGVENNGHKNNQYITVGR